MQQLYFYLQQLFKIESILLRRVGSAFYSVGAATLKDLSPKAFFSSAGCDGIEPELERSE